MQFRSKPVRTRGDSRRRAPYSFAPRPACLFRRALLGIHFPSAPKSFRINTCKSLSKQTTLTIFRMIDLQKTGGGGLLLLTRNSKPLFCGLSAISDPVGVTGHLFSGCRLPAGMLRFGVPCPPLTPI